MSILDLWASPPGRAAGAAALAVLTAATLFMTIRLRRRSRAYRLLLAGVAAALAAQLGAAVQLPAGARAGTMLALEAVRTLSFLIINAAALELYCRPRRLDRLLTYLLALLLPAGLALQLVPLPAGAAALLPPGGLALPALHAAAVVVAVLAFAGTLPRIGRQRLYGTGLAAFLAAGLARMAADLTGQRPSAVLVSGAELLELLYALVLFLFVFETVLDRLKSVYSSASRDGLTGLYTRQHFIRKTERYRSRGFKVAILFCDIDNFKRLNDTQGHQAADDVLKRVAGILEEESRGIGTAGRYGGEELVAAIAHSAGKPAAVAEAIRRRVEAETPVTVSIGWSTAAPDGSLAEAIKQADEAMYKSKNSGKNKVTAHRRPPAPRPPAAAGHGDDATRELGARG